MSSQEDLKKFILEALETLDIKDEDIQNLLVALSGLFDLADAGLKAHKDKFFTALEKCGSRESYEELLKPLAFRYFFLGYANGNLRKRPTDK